MTGASPPTSVLVVSGGGFQGLGLVQALRARPATRIVVCDIFEEGLTRYLADCYEVVPPVDAPAFAQALLALAVREHVEVVFPSSVHELRMLADLVPRLALLGIKVAVPPQPLLDCLLDKQQTAHWLLSHGIPAQQPLPFAQAATRLPVIGKPRHGWGGTGMRVLRTEREVAAQQDAGDQDDYLWVPFLARFSEFSGDVALGPHGGRSPLVMRRRLRTSGGFSIISESVEDAEIEQLFERAIGALQASAAHGLFNLQIIAPQAGDAFISDVNPRIGTSASHALAEGINLVDAYLEMCRREATTAAQAPAIASPVAAAPPHRMRRRVKTVRLLHDRIVPRIARPAAVVFDLDDTLIDHKRWIFDRLLLAMQAVGLPERAETSGLPLLLARLVDEGERRLLIDRVAEATGVDQPRLLAAYRAAVPAEVVLYPDVESTLQALHAGGVAIAILTDNPPATQQAKIAAMPRSVRQTIDRVLFTQEHDGEKPDASGFLAAAAALDLEAGQCVMAGDNYFRDGVAAIDAGYAHAFVIRRPGAFIQSHAFLSALVPAGKASRIHYMDDLTTLRETVLHP